MSIENVNEFQKCVFRGSMQDNGMLYQTPPIPRCYANNGEPVGYGNASEDLSLTLPPAYGNRESDQLSVSSSSSFGGKSPRDRHRCLPSDSHNAPGIYLPMAPLSSPASANSKVSVSTFNHPRLLVPFVSILYKHYSAKRRRLLIELSLLSSSFIIITVLLYCDCFLQIRWVKNVFEKESIIICTPGTDEETSIRKDDWATIHSWWIEFWNANWCINNHCIYEITGFENAKIFEE